MQHDRYKPGSPEDWLRHAKSDLELSHIRVTNGILHESLCFHAQQAVEKSLKAVLVCRGIEFPKTHNIKVLIELLPDSITLYEELNGISSLTDYAVTIRYPGDVEPVTDEEHRNAVLLADSTVAWAENLIIESKKNT